MYTHSDSNFDEIPRKVCTIPCMYALGGGGGGVTGVGPHQISNQ